MIERSNRGSWLLYQAMAKWNQNNSPKAQTNLISSNMYTLPDTIVNYMASPSTKYVAVSASNWLSSMVLYTKMQKMLWGYLFLILQPPSLKGTPKAWALT